MTRAGSHSYCRSPGRAGQRPCAAGQNAISRPSLASAPPRWPDDSRGPSARSSPDSRSCSPRRRSASASPASRLAATSPSASIRPSVAWTRGCPCARPRPWPWASSSTQRSQTRSRRWGAPTSAADTTCHWQAYRISARSDRTRLRKSPDSEVSNPATFSKSAKRGRRSRSTRQHSGQRSRSSADAPRFPAMLCGWQGKPPVTTVGRTPQRSRTRSRVTC